MKLLKKFLPIAILASLLLIVLQLPQIPSVFFWATAKEKIDFALATGQYDAKARVATYEDKSVTVPEIEAAFTETILGETVGVERRIEIDLTNQKLYAFEGDKRVFEFAVSTGKPWWATPTGDYRIWIKLRYVRMEGGSKEFGTYYNLPNVPYTMFIYNDSIPKWKGYGIHGAYWHNNFGHPMSHGCINMRIEEAGRLYNWVANDFKEVKVSIYGETPKS